MLLLISVLAESPAYSKQLGLEKTDSRTYLISAHF